MLRTKANHGGGTGNTEAATVHDSPVSRIVRLTLRATACRYSLVSEKHYASGEIQREAGRDPPWPGRSRGPSSGPPPPASLPRRRRVSGNPCPRSVRHRTVECWTV